VAVAAAVATATTEEQEEEQRSAIVSGENFPCTSESTAP